jgi:hypothetical protein
VDQVINKREALVIVHLIPLQPAFLGQTTKSSVGIFHPSVAILRFARGQFDQYLLPHLRRELAKELEHLIIFKSQLHHGVTCCGRTDYTLILAVAKRRQGDESGHRG